MRSQIKPVQAPQDRRHGFPKRDAQATASGQSGGAEECLITDHRAVMRPAEAVENKLRQILRDASVGTSNLQT